MRLSPFTASQLVVFTVVQINAELCVTTLLAVTLLDKICTTGTFRPIGTQSWSGRRQRLKALSSLFLLARRMSKLSITSSLILAAYLSGTWADGCFRALLSMKVLRDPLISGSPREWRIASLSLSVLSHSGTQLSSLPRAEFAPSA